MHIRILLLTLILALLGTSPAYALREARPLTIDGRLKTINFHPLEVYKFTGYYYFQSIIELDPEEKIATISVGSPSGWQIQPAGHRIFIKPISNTPEEALTNMTVITSKRMYFFELHAGEAKDVTDQLIPFIIRFQYPLDATNLTNTMVSKNGPDLSEPGKYNFNYTLTGPEIISPVRVFDDNTFTYFEFRENSPIPAFFEVNSEGEEGLVNYRVEGKYMVIERVISQFTLRYGTTAVCIFNESRPLPPPKGKKGK